MTALSVSNGLNIFGLGIIIFVLVLSAVALNVKDRVQLWFFVNVVLIVLAFIFEIFSKLLIGHSGSTIRLWIQILDFLSYSVSVLNTIAFSLYLYEYLRSKTIVNKNLFFTVAAISGMTCLMSVIAFTNGLYFRFDEYNNLIQQPTFWISQICYVITLFLWLWLIFRYVKVLRTREWLSLIFFVFASLVCYSLEIMIPDFYLSLFGGALGMALIYVNIQMDLKYQMQLKEAELTEARISVMLSQIQPHFLYNSLTAIDNLFYNDPEKGHEALYTFSDYLRGNMDSLAQKELVKFEQELEHTRQYLHLEKLRFRDKLEITYDIQVLDFWLPVLTLQPIVENAVRYGASKRYSGGTIAICTVDAGQVYRITVADNGEGFDPERPLMNDYDDGRSHMGIANVRARLLAMCGGTLRIVSEIGKGTMAVIEIPKDRGKMG